MPSPQHGRLPHTSTRNPIAGDAATAPRCTPARANLLALTLLASVHASAQPALDTRAPLPPVRA